jgi:hypothetical protein
MFSLRLYIARSGTLTCNDSNSLNPNLKLTSFQRCGHEQEHLVKCQGCHVINPALVKEFDMDHIEEAVDALYN